MHASFDHYTGKAKHYADYRPSYPSALIAFIESRLVPLSSVADIGSGTGKMCRLLLEMGSKVYGVEPNADMRAEAENQLLAHPAFVSINGTGEDTGLETNSIDAIVCAEAYHWFDNQNSRTEFRRILKRDGYVFLVWNIFSSENACAQDFNALNARLCAKNACATKPVSKEERAANLFGEEGYKKETFDNTISESLEALRGGMLSASFAPREGEPDFQEYVQGIKEIFDLYQVGGQIKVIFKSVCYWGKL